MKRILYFFSVMLCILAVTGCQDRDIIDFKDGVSLPPVTDLKSSLTPDNDAVLEWKLPSAIPEEIQHGSCDGDALTLATGKLVRVTTHHGSRHLDHVQQFLDTVGTPLLIANLVDAQGLLNGTEDGVHRVERTVRVLEHRLHMAAETEQILGLERGGVAAFVEHFAGSGLQQVKHHVRHGGLAGTGFAHDVPSMAEPSKPRPSSNAASSSAGAIATDFSVPNKIGRAHV